MKKKLVCMLLASVMAVGSLAGCGSNDDSSAGDQQDSGGDQSADDGQDADDSGSDDSQTGEKDFEGDGQVINIYVWNEEFRDRLNDIYPEVKEVSSDKTTTTLKDGREIHWINNPNQDGVYQQKLDEALMKQADASDDEKVDIFLAETDYVFKYTDADVDVAMPLTDLGIDPDTDLADQYEFSKVIASDLNGVQRASTWQCTPGLLVYRRDIAKEVFGTDDPEEIGEKVKDWDTIKATAEELKAAGYFTFSSYADTFRLYGNSIAEPWATVNPDTGEATLKVDQKIVDWINDSKEWLDAGYVDKNIKGQWNDDWNKAMGTSSNVFAFLFPAWGIDFTLAKNWDGEDGVWAVTNPPQEYNWGGSYVIACQGTDNPKYVKDIILSMTADKDNMIEISKKYSDYTNTVSGMKEAAENSKEFASAFLGGQNAFAYFEPVAERIVIAPLSAYDQGCVELIQNSFSDYLQGIIDYDKAKQNFETGIIERYPDITEIIWP